MTELLRMQNIYPNWPTPELEAPQTKGLTAICGMISCSTENACRIIIIIMSLYAFFQKATFQHQLLPCSQSLRQLRPVCIYDHERLQQQTHLQHLSLCVV